MNAQTKYAYPEANLAKLLSIENEATIKDESGLGHVVVNSLPINLLELLPLGSDHDSLLVLAGLERRWGQRNLLLDYIASQSQRSTRNN